MASSLRGLTVTPRRPLALRVSHSYRRHFWSQPTSCFRPARSMSRTEILYDNPECRGLIDSCKLERAEGIEPSYAAWKASWGAAKRPRPVCLVKQTSGGVGLLRLESWRAVKCGPLPAFDLKQEQFLFRFAGLVRVRFRVDGDGADHTVKASDHREGIA